MTDPLKKALKDQTAVIHLNNLAWNVTKKDIKSFCFEAGKKYVAKNKHLKKKKTTKKNEKEKNSKNVNPYYSMDLEAGKFCTQPIEVFIKYRNGFSTGRANVTFATNEEANIVVSMLNGKELNGRKVSINWALPIKNYRFQEQRNLALNIKENVAEKKKKEQVEDKESKEMEVEEEEEEVDGDDDEKDYSMAFKKIKKWKTKRINEKKKKKSEVSAAWTVDIVGEKKGKKRKQTFNKQHTKKIKMTL